MTEERSPRTGRQLETFDPSRVLAPHREPPLDPLGEARKFAARSRRRTMLLAIATVLAWVVACGAGIGTAEIYFNRILPQSPFREYRYAQLHEEIEGKHWKELTEDQQREFSTRQRVLGQANELMMLASQATVVLFGIAALLSVWLTIASRRTALRQINANLLALTLELRKVLPESAPAAR